MKKTIIAAVIVVVATLFSNAHAATGIYGGYVTIGGTKYKSSASYGGPEATLGAASLGTFNIGGSLVFSQMETLTFQNSGHSTFEFALAYRIRLQSDAKSTNPANYAFITMGDGVDIGSGNEKAEVTGQTINLISGLTPSFSTIYAIDIIHKAGAWEGGSNFERLANLSNTNPGSTNWASTNAFTANFTVIPEPSTWMLLAGSLTLFMIFRRRRMTTRG